MTKTKKRTGSRHPTGTPPAIHKKTIQEPQSSTSLQDSTIAGEVPGPAAATSSQLVANSVAENELVQSNNTPNPLVSQEESEDDRSLLRDLLDLQTPLYSLDELKSRIRAFSLHLSDPKNVDSLVKYGLPKRAFVRSYWLDMAVGNLYFTKWPMKVTGSWEGEILDYAYEWPVEPLDEKRFLDSIQRSWLKEQRTEYVDVAPTVVHGGFSFYRLTVTGDRPTRVSRHNYPQAAPLGDVTPEHTAMVTEMRRSILALKLRVLRTLYYGIRAKDPELVSAECAKHLFECSFSKDFGFLCDFERCYPHGQSRLDLGLGDRSLKHWEFDDCPGGITSLVRIIGHVEKEIRLRTLDMTRAKFGNLLRPDNLITGTHAGSNLSHEFSRLRRNSQIADAIDIYRRQFFEEQEFWAKFRKTMWAILLRPEVPPAQRYLRHNKDFTRCHGILFTPEQARVVKLLYSVWCICDDFVPEKEIFDEIDPGATRYMHSIFREDRNADWIKLIEKRPKSDQKIVAYRIRQPKDLFPVADQELTIERPVTDHVD